METHRLSTKARADLVDFLVGMGWGAWLSTQELRNIDDDLLYRTFKALKDDMALYTDTPNVTVKEKPASEWFKIIEQLEMTIAIEGLVLGDGNGEVTSRD